MGSHVQVRRAARRITRPGGLVTVEDQTGELDTFTDVVIAAHADEAVRLLGDPSTDERDILGAFQYTPNLAVLHDDRALMPRRRSVWASWNYVAGSADDDSAPLCVSYWMNKLQSLKTKRQLFVTLNPSVPPKPESIIRAIEYTHPLFDSAALAAQDDLWKLQGVRNTWFCGSYFGYGFHEDALQSGLSVAEMLGAPAPWTAKPRRIATHPHHLEPVQ
jgi:predicted NAD/FAD-binding protein